MTECIYYNAKLYNNKRSPIMAQLNDTRNQAILQRADQYRASIIRFSVNGSLLPLLIPTITTVSAPLITTYSVTLTFAGASVQQYVVYTPPTNGQLKFSLGQVRYAYYYFNSFLDDLNEAFRVAYINLLGVRPAMPATTPPVMSWDPVKQLFTLYTESSYVTTPIMISMNADLFNLFQSYQSIFNGYDSVFGRDYDLVMTLSNTINSSVPPETLPPIISAFPVPVYGLVQEFKSLSQFSPVQSIFFTSYIIPAKNEYLPFNNLNSQSVNVGSDSLPIITDFEPILGSDMEFNRGQTQYLPTAQYRYITLESDINLNTIDLQAYWTDPKGTVYPLLIDVGYYVSVKILFEKIK